MAYRTYVGTTGKKNIQILGNNESYEPFIYELQRQGIEVNEDGCFSGDIKDLQPIIDVLEKYIMDINEHTMKYKNRNIFDMTPSKEQIDSMGLTMSLVELRENAYIFVTANLIEYLGDNIGLIYDEKLNRFVYKIKKGKKVWFEAY